MREQRPTNLAINTIALPVTAYASILHRVSGVIVWFAMISLLLALCCALQSEQSFNDIKAAVSDYFILQFVIWGYLTALSYYCLGTLKHIVQEFGYCEELNSGKAISWLVIILALVLSIICAGWIWL